MMMARHYLDWGCSLREAVIQGAVFRKIHSILSFRILLSTHRECFSSGSETALSNATTLSTAATFSERAETKSLLYKTSFRSEEHNPHFCEQKMNYALVSVATSGVSSKLSVSVFLYETCVFPPKAFRRLLRAFTNFVRGLCLTSNNSNV